MAVPASSGISVMTAPLETVNCGGAIYPAFGQGGEETWCTSFDGMSRWHEQMT